MIIIMVMFTALKSSKVIHAEILVTDQQLTIWHAQVKHTQDSAIRLPVMSNTSESCPSGELSLA